LVQKFQKTGQTIKLYEIIAIILAHIEVSNKFIIFYTWYGAKWNPKGTQHGQNNKSSPKGGHIA
jgi:hypothetical protein